MKLSREKGVGGLNILLGAVVTLFILGLLVFIFALMGSSLTATTMGRTAPAYVYNESLALTSANPIGTLAVDSYYGAGCTFIGSVFNKTNSIVVNSGNYTTSGCTINATKADVRLQNATWYVSYDYTYSINGEASIVANQTSTSIAGVTTWFPIIITIVALVVLILLTVLVISAIRGAGMLDGNEGAQGSGEYA